MVSLSRHPLFVGPASASSLFGFGQFAFQLAAFLGQLGDASCQFADWRPDRMMLFRARFRPAP